jgi:small subunit ribosomal protein S15
LIIGFNDCSFTFDELQTNYPVFKHLRSWWGFQDFSIAEDLLCNSLEKIRMSLSQVETKEVLKKFGKSAEDTGSTEVQVALLTARLNKLSGHFQTHIKDHHSRRGLLKLVGHRRRLLKYLERTRPESYKKLTNELGIRA